jgi:hypothetical protein
LHIAHRFRQFTDGLFNQAGFTPNCSFEGDDLSSVIGFVAAGFGLAIVPPACASSPRVASLRLVKPTPRRSIAMGWIDHRYFSASARLFRDFVLANRKLQTRGESPKSLTATRLSNSRSKFERDSYNDRALSSKMTSRAYRHGLARKRSSVRKRRV